MSELNVTLRLLLDQVQGDAAKAAEIIKAQLGAALRVNSGSKSFDGVNSGIKKSMTLVDQFGQKINKTWKDAHKAMEIPKGTIQVFDAWGKTVVKGIKDGMINGQREVGGKDLAKVFGLPDINDIKDKIKEIDPVLKAWREKHAGGIAPDQKINSQ